MDMTWQEGGLLLVQVATGIGLAACAGLRAFLPLLVVGAAGRLELLPLTSSFEWLASWPALIVFGVAVVTELTGDKFPIVDHFLDVAQTVVKPIAGTVVVASVMTELSPLQAVVLGIVLGGPAAAAVHLVKAKLRLVSTATTAGMANPVLSLVEDTGALGGSVAAILAPFVVLALLVAALVAAFFLLRRYRARVPRPA